MAVEYHVATFFYDGATTNRWVRDVGPRGRIRPQSVEEFMGMVSDDETNAVVISVTDRPDQQVQSRTTPDPPLHQLQPSVFTSPPNFLRLG